MDKDQRKDQDIKTRTGKLTVEEIEEIHEVFVETGSCVSRTARNTGFSKSTVSKYVEQNGWREELLNNSIKQLDQQTERKDIMDESPLLTKNDGKTTPDGYETNGEAEGQVMLKLVTLRGLLFEEIMGDERAKTLDGSPLRILPRTLAEAVKALIDVDKRITEREGTQPITVLGTYQSILARCARVVENEPK